VSLSCGYYAGSKVELVDLKVVIAGLTFLKYVHYGPPMHDNSHSYNCL